MKKSLFLITTLFTYSTLHTAEADLDQSALMTQLATALSELELFKQQMAQVQHEQTSVDALLRAYGLTPGGEGRQALIDQIVNQLTGSFGQAEIGALADMKAEIEAMKAQNAALYQLLAGGTQDDDDDAPDIRGLTRITVARAARMMMNDTTFQETIAHQLANLQGQIVVSQWSQRQSVKMATAGNTAAVLLQKPKFVNDLAAAVATNLAHNEVLRPLVLSALKKEVIQALAEHEFEDQTLEAFGVNKSTGEFRRGSSKGKRDFLNNAEAMNTLATLLAKDSAFVSGMMNNQDFMKAMEEVARNVSVQGLQQDLEELQQTVATQVNTAQALEGMIEGLQSQTTLLKSQLGEGLQELGDDINAQIGRVNSDIQQLETELRAELAKKQNKPKGKFVEI